MKIQKGRKIRSRKDPNTPTLASQIPRHEGPNTLPSPHRQQHTTHHISLEKTMWHFQRTHPTTPDIRHLLTLTSQTDAGTWQHHPKNRHHNPNAWHHTSTNDITNNLTPVIPCTLICTCSDMSRYVQTTQRHKTSHIRYFSSCTMTSDITDFDNIWLHIPRHLISHILI
jgi:hypothetical protein